MHGMNIKLACILFTGLVLQGFNTFITQNFTVTCIPSQQKLNPVKCHQNAEYPKRNFMVMLTDKITRITSIILPFFMSSVCVY
jgi:hypothetical protein